MTEPFVKITEDISFGFMDDEGNEVQSVNSASLIQLIGEELGDLAMQDGDQSVRQANDASVDNLELFAGEILNLIRLYKELPTKYNVDK